MPSLVIYPGLPSERSVEIREGAMTVGRGREADVFVLDKSMSRLHARLEYDGTKVVISDTGSTNGVYVAGRKVTSVELTPGDSIRCGDVPMAFAEDPRILTERHSEGQRSTIERLLGDETYDGTTPQDGQRLTGGSREKLHTLFQVTETLSSPEGIEAPLERVLDLLFETTLVDRAVILLIDEQSGEARPEIVRSRVAPVASQPAPRPGGTQEVTVRVPFPVDWSPPAPDPDEAAPIYSRNIVRHVLDKEVALITSDASHDDRWSASDSILAQSIRSSMCVPLKARDRLIGAIYVDSLSVSNGFTNDDLDYLSAFANQAAVAIESSRLYARLLETSERARVSQQRYEMVASHLPIVLFATDERGNLTFADGHGLTLLGDDPEACVGRPLVDLLGDDRVEEHCRRVLAGSNVEGTIERGERAFDARYSPLRDADGKVTGVIGVLTDATERLRARERELAREAAEAASQAKSTFLANMSHELRTPLNAIIGYTELLQDEARDTEGSSLVADLEKITKAGHHLLALINDILDLSKIEAGRMDLAVEEFAVAPLVAEVLETVRPLVEKGENVLETHGIEQAGSMLSDPFRVKQILFNLLSNASKFTEKGTIGVAVARDVERISFRVSDTGVGMTAEQLGRLFQVFRQAKASTARTHGGTGLGLCISQSLSRMMGGDITAKSAPGEGSTFEVVLPLQAPPRAPAPGS